MSGTNQLLDTIEIDLVGDSTLTVYVDVFENSLSCKWLNALNHLLTNNYHLEKNYCFLGFADGPRRGPLILDLINQSIQAINSANIGYQIDDYFDMNNCITDVMPPGRNYGRILIHEHLNQLHRYFEDLQGVSGSISEYYKCADPTTRWHIRQLNLLCHEFESWALSYRQQLRAPDWQRPSQLMCWLNAPRFVLDDEDYELFGIETINRPLGGVFVGVNKAVGKHHWEVFNDEGRDSRVNELTTTVLKNQTEAAGDFDIEWGQNPGDYSWHQKTLTEFRGWLIDNGFDPENKKLTIGHPQVGQVDLLRTFGSTDHTTIWASLINKLNVREIRTASACAEYKYSWSDKDFAQRQINIIKGN